MPRPVSRSAKSNMRSVMKVVCLGSRWSKPASDIKPCTIRKLFCFNPDRKQGFLLQKGKRRNGEGWWLFDRVCRAAEHTLSSVTEDTKNVSIVRAERFKDCFCLDTQLVRSEFGTECINPWTQLALWWRWCDDVGNEMISCHTLGLLRRFVICNYS